MQISSYQIDREIGRGATSVVYRAGKDGAWFAIKLMKQATSDDVISSALRFRREAAIIARLNHPNLVKVLEVGESEGQTYVVMELIEGQNLAALIQSEGCLAEDRAVDIVKKIAGALSQVHRLGLVHQDIKPDNILVEENGLVKLIDFGFAAETSDGTPPTDSNVVGTFLYAAPEQSGMIRRPVDARSDLYGLGGVLYECLAGRPAYQADSVLELLKKHASAPVPDLRAVNASLRPALAEIARKLLSKDPDDRYQTAEGLIADLDALSRLDRDLAENKARLDVVSSRMQLRHEVPLVGRDQELKILQDAWKAAAQHRGQFCQVEGEGGLGKTRLTLEVLGGAAAERSLNLRGKCQEGDAVPFGVIREAIDDFIVRISSLPESEGKEIVSLINRAAGDLAPVIRKLSRGLEKVIESSAAAGGLDALSEQARLYDSLAGFLLRLAREGDRIVLLLIDDVQWIDSSSMEVLKRIALECASAPFLLLTTARNDPASQKATDRFVSEMGEDHLRRIILRPLSVDAVEAFVRAFLGGRGPERSVVERLAHVTNGNVFAVGEYVRSMLNSGALLPKGVGWEVNVEQFDQLIVSGNVLQLVLNRVNLLSKDAINILATAAVYGRSFNKELLEACSSEGEFAVLRAIDEAARASLIERVSGDSLAFVHDRVREALVENLSEDELKERHELLANALFDKKDESPEHVFSLARHCVNGHVRQNLRRGFTVSLRAGKLALASYANELAYELLSEAMKLREELVLEQKEIPEDSELDEAIGVAASRVGKLKEAHGYFAKCLQKAKSPSDLARIHFLICTTYNSEGNFSEAWESMGRCLQLIGKPVPKTRLGLLLGLLGYLVLGQFLDWTGLGYGKAKGKARTVRGLASQIMPIASQITISLGLHHVTTYFAFREFVNSHYLGTSPERARALSYFAFLLGSLYVFAFRSRVLSKCFGGKLKHRVVEYYAKRGIVLAEQTGDVSMIAFCRYGHGISLHMTGDLVEAEALLRGALPLQKKYSGYSLPTVNLFFIMLNLCWRGASREAIELSSVEMETLIRSKNRNSQIIVFGLAYWQLSLLGRASEARQMREKWKAQLAQTQSSLVARATECAYELGCLLDREDYGDETEQLIEELRALGFHNNFVSIFDVLIGYVRMEQMFNADASRKGWLMKDLERAIRDIERFENLPVFTCHAQIMRSAILSQEKNLHAASRHLDQAHALARDAGSSWGLFEAARQRARNFVRAGDMESSMGYAYTALEIANRQGWVNRAKQVHAEFGIEVRPFSEDRKSQQYTTITRSRMLKESYNDALLRVSLASSSSLDPIEQANAAMDELVSVLNAERAYLFLKDDKSGDLEMRAGRDSAATSLTELKGYSSTVVKKVLEAGTPLVVSGTEEGEVLGSQSAVAHNLRSIIATPLSLRGKLIGVIYLDSRMAKGIFSEEDVEIVSAIANHVAIALETSRMARVEAERRALARDLELTAAVQTLFLPEKKEYSSDSIRLSGFYQAATQASGDWWWYFADESNRLTVLVGDVTGHGAASAMLTASTASYLQGLREGDSRDRERSVSELLVELNKGFCQVAKGNYLMTMSGLLLDARSGKVGWWNAGGPPVFILSKDKEREPRLLSAAGAPLGTADFSVGFKEAELEAGDRLVIFTDGIPEMRLPSGRFLKLKGMRDCLKRIQGIPLPEAKMAFCEELEKSRQDVPLEDDLTFVMIDYEGK